MPRTSTINEEKIGTACPEWWYLLGAYYSDDCVTKSLTGETKLTTQISAKDADWIESIRDEFFPESNVRETPHGHAVLTVQNQTFVRALLEHGCTERKSLTIQMPDVPAKFLPDFVRGLWDGDGSIQNQEKTQRNGAIKKYSRARIHTGSKKFRDQLKVVLDGLEMFRSIKEQRSGSDNPNNLVYAPDSIVYSLSINSDQSIPFLKWMYYDGFPEHICLKRKYKEARTAFKNYEARYAKKQKTKIMNEENKALCRRLREDFSLGAIEVLTGIKVPNFASYVRDIKPKKKQITKEEVLQMSVRERAKFLTSD